MRIDKKVFFLIICITLLSLTLVGCYDLGDATETDEEYCELYPEIKVIYGSDDVDSYDMEDFYNKEAVNDFKSPMDEDDRHYYSYLAIKVAKDISVGSIAVHFDSTTADTLSISYYVLDASDLPSKIYTGRGGKYTKVQCNEPKAEDAIGASTCKLAGVADKWQAAMLTEWKNGDATSKRHSVQEGQYIVLRINNNCYDPAKAELDQAEETWEKVQDDYNNHRIDYAAYIVGERDYNLARQRYEENKKTYEKVAIRMTAILINAK